MQTQPEPLYTRSSAEVQSLTNLKKELKIESSENFKDKLSTVPQILLPSPLPPSFDIQTSSNNTTQHINTFIPKIPPPLVLQQTSQTSQQQSIVQGSQQPTSVHLNIIKDNQFSEDEQYEESFDEFDYDEEDYNEDEDYYSLDSQDDYEDYDSYDDDELKKVKLRYIGYPKEYSEIFSKLTKHIQDHAEKQ
ncbi:MAG: hypothetical protein EZS28_039875, partial [Streblomastix strix]